MKTSLIVTSQNRTKHLLNLLAGVRRNSVLPNEILIVSNDFKKEQLDFDYPVPTRIVNFNSDIFHNGQNRNLGARLAKYPILLFLDVDCIPNENYFSSLLECIKSNDGLVMGEPKYLSQAVNTNFTYSSLEDDSIYHLHRPRHSTCKKEEDYAIFWSLCFGISQSNWEIIGGFDENFVGYGAEDTDFGFTAKAKNIDFLLTDARVYHQQHAVFQPPVNHLKDIVFNSNLFYKKWNVWPMGGWLTEFTALGLIDWDNQQKHPIQIKKTLSDKALASYKHENARFV